MKNSGDPFIVKYAKFRETRLVDQNDNYHPSISVSEAQKKAVEAHLDLVCFNRPGKSELAFCKIVDYGKWKYSNEKSKKKINALTYCLFINCPNPHIKADSIALINDGNLSIKSRSLIIGKNTI